MARDYDVFENNCEDFALYCKTGLLPPPAPMTSDGAARRPPPYITDIGMRKDVVKVEVENLVAHLGWRRAKAAEEAAVKKQQQPPPEKKATSRLLPLKRKREICV
ncbi:hypothetical protein BAE44_0002969 [Dichanthelium oligosanthes]|uniref:LRAT domain-containing protein n=1 Tax=Dichanthelium oligosanthes TaxID=888268 RepID=A0A1E5WF38_9POAL|nr:hypothetical protein BAE44_0002969 [Dichanthelium oligosanthes]